MAIDPIQPSPAGLAGGSCTSCGAPLSPDQRYCLGCGTRRSGAGLHFRQVLASDGAAPSNANANANASAAKSGAAASDPNRSSLPALASIACLLLALGVGVVIGNSGGSTSTTAAPQAVGVAPAAATTDTTAAAKTPTAKKAAATTGAATATKAANPALKKLDSLSPADYQKQSLKLPKVVGTGGAPPPKDNKAPANGGSFQTIG